MADKRVWITDRSKHASYQEAVAKAKKAKRTPPGRWRVHWIDPEGKERNKTFQLLGDERSDRADTARGFKRKLERELNGDAGAVYIDPNAGDTEFGAVVESWWDSVDEVKRSSRQKYRQVIDTHILPRWRHVPLRLMNVLVIAPWMARLRRGGGETTVDEEKIGASQKRMVFTVMNAILDWACPELIAVNPMRDRKKIKRPKPKQITEHCYLDYLDVEALAAAADSLVGAYGKLKAGAAAGINGTLIRSLGYTGQRPGEALALKVENYVQDAKRPVFQVRRTLIEDRTTGELYFDTPKDHEARDVPIPLSLIPDIERLCMGKRSQGLIFSVDGSPLRLGNWRNREFYAARDSLGLPDILTPHKLRHTAASLAIREGATVLSVQKLLGHASPTETLNTYAKLWDDEVWAVAEKLNSARLHAISETAVMDGLVTLVADLARQLEEVRQRVRELEDVRGSEALHRELERVGVGSSEIDGFLRELSNKMDAARAAAF